MLTYQVHLERIEHSLPRHDNLLRLLLDGKRPYECRHLLRRFPFGKLAEALLARPRARVNNLEEELPGPRVEYEYGAVDRLGGEVALEGLVDGDTVDVGVVHKPDDLERVGGH